MIKRVILSHFRNKRLLTVKNPVKGCINRILSCPEASVERFSGHYCLDSCQSSREIRNSINICDLTHTTTDIHLYIVILWRILSLWKEAQLKKCWLKTEMIIMYKIICCAINYVVPIFVSKCLKYRNTNKSYKFHFPRAQTLFLHYRTFFHKDKYIYTYIFKNSLTNNID